MAIQLGALRDALIDAGADPAKASVAAEEVAGYDNRLTRPTTMVQVAIAVLVMLLGSQAALWSQMGELKGQMGELQSRMGDLQSQMADLHTQQGTILTRLNELGAHPPH
jgi:hypothetical protein